MNETNQESTLLSGPIWKKLVLFGLPLLCGNLFQQLYSSVDSIIVGRYVGKEALAAVGSTTSLIFLIVSFFQGVATGSNVIISQEIGAAEHDKVRKSISTSIVLSLVGGVAIGMFFFALTPSILRWTLLPEDIFTMTKHYVQIYVLSLPAIALYNVGTAILRSMGDSRRPLYFLILSSVINTVLDLLFVRSFGMGVEGAALATVIAQYISAALILYVVLRNTGIYALERGEFKFDSSAAKAILYLGLPAAVQSSAVSLANVLFQSQVNIFGSTAVAGYSAGVRIQSFVYMPCVAFGLSATTFVGQSVGAGDYQKVKEISRVCILLSTITTAVLSVVAYLSRYPLLRVFTNDAEAISYGALTLLVIGLPTFLWAFPQIYGCVLTGMGKSVISMTITMMNMCVFRLLWIYILLGFWNDILVVFLSYPISWAGAGVFMVIYYLKTIKKLSREAAA